MWTVGARASTILAAHADTAAPSLRGLCDVDAAPGLDRRQRRRRDRLSMRCLTCGQWSDVAEIDYRLDFTDSAATAAVMPLRRRR